VIPLGSPDRGGTIVAQGQTRHSEAEAEPPPWVNATPPSPFLFPNPVGRAQGPANRIGKRGESAHFAKSADSIHAENLPHRIGQMLG
jgi:hypothetical protein